MDTLPPSVTITNIPNINTIVIKQRGSKFFVSTRDSVVIDLAGLSLIIRFLVINKILDRTILERILDDLNRKEA